MTPTKQPWSLRLLVALWWAVFSLITLLIYLNHAIGAGDYDIYHRGASRVAAGIPLYENLQGTDYLGPPLQVQLLAPIVAVTDYHTSSVLWFGINLGAAVFGVHLLARRLPNPLLFWALVPLFLPLFHSLWFGQVTPILFAVTALAWTAYHERRYMWCGALLAIIVWTKFYPGLFLVYFVWRGDWRVVAGGVVGTVGVVGFQVLVSGPQTFITYLTEVLPLLFSEGQPHLNHAFNAVLNFSQRLFIASPYTIPLFENPALASALRLGVSALLAGVLVIQTRRLPRHFDLEFALVLTTALLLGSTLAIYGMLTMLLCFVVLWMHAGTARDQRRVFLAILVIGAGANVHLLLMLAPQMARPALLLSMPFFGMMSAWALNVWQIAAQRTAAPAPTP